MESVPYGTGTKKTWELSFSVPILEVRPSHCPLERISNVKPAHVNLKYRHRLAQQSHTYIHTDNPREGAHLIIYIKESDVSMNINHPRRRLCCITVVPRFKVAKFDFHRSVTFENAF